MEPKHAIAVAIGVALALPMAQRISAEEFRPGEVIGKDQADRIKGYLPLALERDVQKGELVIPIGAPDPENYHETQAFLAASEKNAGRYHVNEDGTLLDESGNIPAFVYGWPFPHLDSADPNAALKLIWNFRYAYNRYDASVAFGVAWVDRNAGKEREFWAAIQALPYDGRADGPLPNPNRLFSQELIRVVSPSNVQGTNVLTWRYQGPQVDSVWSYVPAIRRVRQLTSANRSDAFLGSDFHIDTAAGWSGKTESFTYKVSERRTILAPLTKPKNPVNWTPIEPTAGWTTLWNKNITEFGYELSGHGGAPWFPTTWQFVPRKVWVIEGTPKDPYYNYGKLVFFMDEEIYQIYYVDHYARSGEFWKLFINVARRQIFPNDVVGLLFGCNVMVDYKAYHASVTPGPPDPGIEQKYRFGPKAADFDLANMVATGK